MVLRTLNPLANMRALIEGWTFIKCHGQLILEMVRGDLTGRFSYPCADSQEKNKGSRIYPIGSNVPLLLTKTGFIGALQG